MKEKKLGVWLIGALGSISTTVIVGALALRKGLTEATGMITTTEVFSGLALVDLDAIVFGGCDIRDRATPDAVRQVLNLAPGLGHSVYAAIEAEFQDIVRGFSKGTVRNCGDAIQQLAASCPSRDGSLRDEISEVRKCLQWFRQEHSLDEMVVVNLASTEPVLEIDDRQQNLAAFEYCLDRNQVEAVRASTIYAYAAVKEGCPYINFTPSNAALIPAVVELAESNRVPVMGNDGKTGETLVKSVLAPMFSCRNLEVLSWEGFNILGNMDGSILNHPENRESKIRTKDRILAEILGYAPHSRVHIDYVPSLDDQKTAWDFIHFKGFLGARMSLQFVWQGYDSILAAPLILDLVRLAEFAKRRGESGLMPHLASYFKAPLGVTEHRLYEQYRLLLDYAEQAEQRTSKPS
ncbi:MAG: inositol-3-phosphate synthase [Desulforhabdus sp.]|jgi:myo-inositol-1-phosphate synthase|nr:inositol-3-phosphate synthase [Desulforhabdus sp.]